MADVVATVLEALAGEPAVKAGAVLGLEPATVERGLGALLPVLLAGAARLFGESGAQPLLAMAEGALAGGNPLDRLDSVLGDETARAELLEDGQAMARNLMGRNADGLEAGLASLLSVQPATVRQMAALSAPLLIGGMARASGGALTGESLGALMSSARESLSGQLPAGVATLIDPSWAAGAPAAPPPPTDPQPQGRLWLPWAIAGAVAVAGLVGLRSCQQSGPAVDESRPAVALGEPLDQTVALPRGIIIVVRQGGAVDTVRRYLATAEAAGRRFVIDNLAFDEASNQLTGESQQTIDGIAGVMKAWPDTRIRLIGFTDDVGDAMENLERSQARAAAVKGALVESGVEPERIEVEGRGEAEPIAPNDTEEGRAENRRVELEVIGK